MDARLDYLTDEMCQLNTRVGRIARRQARMVGFTPSPFPSLEALVDEDDDAGADEDDAGSFILFFKKQFSIFENKKLVWQLKMNKKQNMFSKLNLWRKLKTCKMLFSISNFQKLKKMCIWFNEAVSFNELALEFKS